MKVWRPSRATQLSNRLLYPSRSRQQSKEAKASRRCHIRRSGNGSKIPVWATPTNFNAAH